MEKSYSKLNRKAMYNIYAMKNGKRSLIKENLTLAAMYSFINQNQNVYIAQGYNYIIGLPTGN